MVHEWSVMVTDAILALWCFFLVVRALRGAPKEQEAPHTVAFSIGLTGLAAAVGSIRHGWGPDLPIIAYHAFWVGSYMLIMVSGNLLVLGVIQGSCLKQTCEFWKWVCTGRMVLTCSAFMLVGDTFIVAVDWIMTMLMLAIVAVRIWQLGRRELGRDIGIGIGISIVAGVVQYGLFVGTKGSLHDDLCHIIMIPAMYAFMLVARRIRDSV